ncbi:MAG TPA: cytochrome P450 [Actinomycetota bacterium]
MALVEPFAPEAIEDPFPSWEILRREAPVYSMPETGMWLVTRHADLVEAAARPEVFSSRISAVMYAGQGTNPAVIEADPDAIGAVDVLATQDPPAHTLQRKLIGKRFTRARVRAFEPFVRRFVRDALAGAPGEVEWMTAVATPVPLAIIAAMLGLPRDRRDDVHRWADAGIDLLSGVASPERMAEAWAEMVSFFDFLGAQLADPAPETVTADVAGAIAHGELTDREGASLMLQLVIAGSESTASLIGSAVALLGGEPGLQAHVRADAGLLPKFLEEVLRLESPFRGHFRVTTEATTLGGVALPKGARVMLMWGSANRDERAFPSPGALDTGRARLSSHVGFGSGIHTCVGAPLARMEAAAAIAALLEETQSFELFEPVRHVPSLFVRRPARVPIRLR